MSSSGVNLEKYRIPLEEIIRATKNFGSETKIGDGGFGMVHKGQLSEEWQNRTVAIKRHNRNGYQGNYEFRNELKMVSSFHHPNIITFIGYCDDANEMIIVYEYAINGSLDMHLHDPNKWCLITWAQRLAICLGAARGLKYLHSGLGEDKRVIHRDVKSANILLDENLQAKLCDFGLSKFGPRNQPNTQLITKASGTRFYMDPIYNERGRLSKESDIYSFGVVLFEMSSGMLAYRTRRYGEGEEQYLLDLVRSYYDDHEVDGLDKLIDPIMKDDINMRSFHMFNEIAHQCINFDSKKRPTIDRIIDKIEEASNIQSSNNIDGVWPFWLDNQFKNPKTSRVNKERDCYGGFGEVSYDEGKLPSLDDVIKRMSLPPNSDKKYFEEVSYDDDKLPTLEDLIEQMNAVTRAPLEKEAAEAENRTK